MSLSKTIIFVALACLLIPVNGMTHDVKSSSKHWKNHHPGHGAAWRGPQLDRHHRHHRRLSAPHRYSIRVGHFPPPTLHIYGSRFKPGYGHRRTYWYQRDAYGHCYKVSLGAYGEQIWRPTHGSKCY